VTQDAAHGADTRLTIAASALARFFRILGPGLVTGAADDDPSGIGTYSIAGAQFGFGVLWTAWFSAPLMASAQVLCSRLALITGRGLASLIRERFGLWILWPACVFLTVANVANIAADLGAMAASTAMIFRVPAYCFTPLYTAALLALMIWTSYHAIARIFKWMTLVLFAYVIAALLAHPAWDRVLRATFIPHVEWSASYLAAFVAILGTTISPYLFFWQANQEIEEEVEHGKITLAQRRGATGQEKRDSRTDVVTGAVFSNLVMYFIILTAGATLHAHGEIHIGTTEQAAEALRPFAGRTAYLLFTLGIVGTGMLCVPVLAGSTAYAIAEAAKWRVSLRCPPHRAPQFYRVLAAAFAIGLALNFAGVGAIDMLFWSAILNGLLAPPLLFLVVRMASDPVVMGGDTVSPLLRALGWFTTIVMTLAAIAMFVV
jgi:NRAMP (natural resistance-associated macrophage protein)-like metal ion transporter